MPPGDLVVEALRALVRDAVREVLADAPAEASPYYTAQTAPCGARAFLRAARRGEFPAFERGEHTYARREDVNRWIEACPLVRAAPGDSPAREPTDEEILAANGKRLGGPARSARRG